MTNNLQITVGLQTGCFFCEWGWCHKPLTAAFCSSLMTRIFIMGKTSVPSLISGSLIMITVCPPSHLGHISCHLAFCDFQSLHQQSWNKWTCYSFTLIWTQNVDSNIFIVLEVNTESISKCSKTVPNIITVYDLHFYISKYNPHCNSSHDSCFCKTKMHFE